MGEAEQTQYLAFLGMLSQLPEEQQEKIRTLSQVFREAVADNGNEGMLAFALVGLEMQTKD